MKLKIYLTVAATLAVITSASATVTMDWVNVGNPGNAADTTGFGAVSYAYKIGKYEVTNAQYGEFLSAKGQTNSTGIYNPSMLGITQSGGPGTFTYAVTPTLANHPVVCVSLFDAARFANWLLNGQGAGDMETGAYTLNGALSGVITANIGALIYIPSENEWYKAAYYNAASANYSPFPNGQNTISNSNANYGLASSATSPVGNYSSASAYGTFDQGGNVWEWNDGAGSSADTWRGGGSMSPIGHLDSSFSIPSISPGNENSTVGFRVAGIEAIPETTSMLLTLFAGGMMLIRRKR
jgi:formylglycine-generating enzyme required for sulfatase activity